MQPSCALRVAALIFTGVAFSSAAQLPVGESLPPVAVTGSGSAQITLQPATITLHGGAGSVPLTVRNTGAVPVTFTATVSPMEDDNTHAVLARGKASLSLGAESGSAAAPTLEASRNGVDIQNLAPGSAVSIEVSITGASGASTADLPIFVSGPALGSQSAVRLKVIQLDAPLNLSTENGASTTTPLDYNYDSPTALTIKNGDPQPYPVKWRFVSNGQTLGSNSFYIGANSQSRILLKPVCDEHGEVTLLVRRFLGRPAAPNNTACQMYSPIDRIHPSAGRGVLLLSLQGPTDIPLDLLPARAIPVSLLMHRVSEQWSTAYSYIYAGTLLLLGGLFSILATSVLPYQQRRAQLRSQLNDLATRTTSVSSTRIDSYLRVLLRLEHSRIADSMASASGWIPDPVDPIEQLTRAMDTLSKRLTAAERLDGLRGKHDQVSSTAPPSVTDAIDANLRSGAEHLHAFALSDEDLKAANGFLDAAQTSLAMLEDFDALAKLVALNFISLKKRLEQYNDEQLSKHVAALKNAIPGVFIILDKPFEDSTKISPRMLFAIDHDIAAIQTALDYVMVKIGVPSGEPSDVCEVARCNRLLEREHELIDLLGTFSWRALREATLLVQEMRENVYEEDILGEMRDSKAEITSDPPVIGPSQPVFFSIEFKNSRFNGAAALQRLLCHWTFPDGTREKCWEVCTYFNDRNLGLDSQPGNWKTVSKGTDAAAAATLSASPFKVNQGLGGALRRIWPHWPFRKRAAPASMGLKISAAIRGQETKDTTEVPFPALQTTIRIQTPRPPDNAHFLVGILRFSITFGVALAGLLSGALDQLSKLDFPAATIAIVALGFGANSIKNILTQSPASAPKKA